jgi:hypothetical protein
VGACQAVLDEPGLAAAVGDVCADAHAVADEGAAAAAQRGLELLGLLAQANVGAVRRLAGLGLLARSKSHVVASLGVPGAKPADEGAPWAADLAVEALRLWRVCLVYGEDTEMLMSLLPTLIRATASLPAAGGERQFRAAFNVLEAAVAAVDPLAPPAATAVSFAQLGSLVGPALELLRGAFAAEEAGAEEAWLALAGVLHFVAAFARQVQRVKGGFHKVPPPAPPPRSHSGA